MFPYPIIIVLYGLISWIIWFIFKYHHKMQYGTQHVVINKDTVCTSLAHITEIVSGWRGNYRKSLHNLSSSNFLGGILVMKSNQRKTNKLIYTSCNLMHTNQRLLLYVTNENIYSKYLINILTKHYKKMLWFIEGLYILQ